MYAKVVDGVVVKYPYTEADLKADYPNTSFPANGWMAHAGVVHVVVTGTPDGMVEGPPQCVDGVWYQSWL